MSAEQREIAVPKYFIKQPKEPAYVNQNSAIPLIGIGLIGSFIYGLGLPLVLYGGYQYITAGSTNEDLKLNYEKDLEIFNSRPTDEQMDAWQNAVLDRIKTSALTKLDLIEGQVIGEPIMITGPSEGALLAIGKDNLLRFSKYDVVTVYLTNYHLAAYSCTFDMSTGLETKETTQEYRYKDIVSVTTKTDNSRLFKVVVDGQEKPLAEYQKFSLSVANGERIEVAIAFPQLEKFINNARYAPTGAENAVKTIRAMLREDKDSI
ncbi:MAG TPA: hypothetical protein VNJ29_03750 [Candidatus Nitrosotenuis sp.]|nr:hypothetical protein [Candidatus Nitrosotenuis sp.]